MKRKNYYQVHKNKKPKRNTEIKPNVIQLFNALTKMLKALTEFQHKQIELKSMYIPNFVKGGIVGGGTIRTCGCEVYKSINFEQVVKRCDDCKKKQKEFEASLKNKLEEKGLKTQ